MTLLINLFANNLLPIFLAALTGYIMGKLSLIEARSLSRVVFYVFSPCLVFDLITSNELGDGDILRMIAFVVISLVIMAGVTILVGRMMKLDRKMMAALLLTSLFMNAGNYGLSVNLFAFGETTLAYASLFFVTTATLIYSVGVIIASMGNTTIKDALLGLLKIPAIYGLIIAFIVLSLQMKLPVPLDRTVNLLSDAAIPTMLVLLGLQLQKVEWSHKPLHLLVANGLRLLAAPAIAIVLSMLFDLQGSARQASIIEASMPCAVTATVLATEFDVQPEFVTAAVTTSTLLSPLTLTPLLAFLGA